MFLAVGFTLLALLTPAALAQEIGECEQECLDQLLLDYEECERQLAERLAELDQAEQECIEQHANDPLQLGLCVQQVNIKRYGALRDARRCKSIANTVAWNCYRACQQSPSLP
jgi:hypothetical protein